MHFIKIQQQILNFKFGLQFSIYCVWMEISQTLSSLPTPSWIVLLLEHLLMTLCRGFTKIVNYRKAKLHRKFHQAPQEQLPKYLQHFQQGALSWVIQMTICKFTLSISTDYRAYENLFNSLEVLIPNVVTSRHISSSHYC